MFVVRIEKRRVGESVHEHRFWEGQLGPRTEVPTWRVSVVHRRGERRRASLSLVRRRVACSLVVDCKVAGEAPDFEVAVEAAKDEMTIFILAVGPGANVKLGSRWYSTLRLEDWLSYWRKTPKENAGEEMGHGEPTRHANRDAYAYIFVDFETRYVAWRCHSTGNDAPFTFPVFFKLKTSSA